VAGGRGCEAEHTARQPFLFRVQRQAHLSLLSRRSLYLHPTRGARGAIRRACDKIAASDIAGLRGPGTR
jgi:hypothetical protein